MVAQVSAGSGPVSEGVRVVPTDLITHAAAMERIAAQVGTDGAAIDGNRPDRAAYGELCQLLPTAMDPVVTRIALAAQALSESLTDTARRLRTSVAGYRDGDAQAAEAYRRLGGR
jgi:hypothetical protein